MNQCSGVQDNGCKLDCSIVPEAREVRRLLKSKNGRNGRNFHDGKGKAMPLPDATKGIEK